MCVLCKVKGKEEKPNKVKIIKIKKKKKQKKKKKKKSIRSLLLFDSIKPRAAVCQNLERLGKEESDSWLGFFFQFVVEAGIIYAYVYILTGCIDVIRELKESHLRYCI